MKMPTAKACEILPDVLYSVSRLQKVTGIGPHAFRNMRRQGLQVRYVAGGRRPFVKGAEFIRFVEEQSVPAPTGVRAEGDDE